MKLLTHSQISKAVQLKVLELNKWLYPEICDANNYLLMLW